MYMRGHFCVSTLYVVVHALYVVVHVLYVVVHVLYVVVHVLYVVVHVVIFRRTYTERIIIYHDFLPTPRRGSHVKSDETHTQSSRYTP